MECTCLGLQPAQTSVTPSKVQRLGIPALHGRTQSLTTRDAPYIFPTCDHFLFDADMPSNGLGYVTLNLCSLEHVQAAGFSVCVSTLLASITICLQAHKHVFLAIACTFSHLQCRQRSYQSHRQWPCQPGKLHRCRIGLLLHQNCMWRDVTTAADCCAPDCEPITQLYVPSQPMCALT